MTRQGGSIPENSIPKHFLRSTPMEISPQQLIASKQFNISSEESWSNKSPRLRKTLRWWGGIGINNEFFSTVKGTVYDRATGLMWQHSGSKQLLTWDEACKYIIWLNKSRFCNYDDWRLPTIEELASLAGGGGWVDDDARWAVTNEDGGVPVYRPFSVDFDQKQTACWSCDMAVAGEWTCPDTASDRLSDYVKVDISPNRVWVFCFGDGIWPSKGPIFWRGILRPAERWENFWVKAVRIKLTHSG
jgi:hypothetical protein